jgi:hypothetical protein
VLEYVQNAGAPTAHSQEGCGGSTILARVRSRGQPRGRVRDGWSNTMESQSSFSSGGCLQRRSTVWQNRNRFSAHLVETEGGATSSRSLERPWGMFDRRTRLPTSPPILCRRGRDTNIKRPKKWGLRSAVTLINSSHPGRRSRRSDIPGPNSRHGYPTLSVAEGGRPSGLHALVAGRACPPWSTRTRAVERPGNRERSWAGFLRPS